MRKILGDTPVRITVRLPKDLYDEWRRAGLNRCDDTRAALRHYLDCPRLRPARNAREAERERSRAALKDLQPLPGEQYWTARFNTMKDG